ncbi:MAG: hypothetical protein RL329_2066 [Bacteroidota bacterium]|jgi:hypothetical protein
MNVQKLIFLSAFALTGCQKKRNAPAHAANPFDTTRFNTQALSAEDKQLLAKATGKTAQPVTTKEIITRFENAKERLHIFCFWNLLNENSMKTAQALNETVAQFDTNRLKTIYVNMPGLQKMEAINLFIREQQLTGETLVLEKGDVSFLKKYVKSDAPITSLPVLLLVNQSNDVLFQYQQPFDAKELKALIEPLIKQPHL